ncbi:MAG: hypothetical protein IPK93_04410 [Solirubrobacterales bacterium]|nr:hypothetical protein [Solirubrobacterales bacterium]
MKNVIETVGGYAGIVSLFGLVVLRMLCFSMARDIRRLREWAGGAPERDAEIREVSEIVAEERVRRTEGPGRARRTPAWSAGALSRDRSGKDSAAPAASWRSSPQS